MERNVLSYGNVVGRGPSEENLLNAPTPEHIPILSKKTEANDTSDSIDV